MKVVQIISRFLLGGAEIMCENLSVALYEDGHDVTVISMNDYHSPITERLEKKGIPLVYLHKRKGPDPFALKRLTHLLNDIQPDVIHCHINSVPYALIAGIRTNVPVQVHTIHSIATGDNVKWVRKIIGWGIKKHNLIPVALGEVTRESIVQEYKIPEERIPIIENGIDLSRCHVKKTYATNSKFRIIHIGRFAEVKNHAGLIQAFSDFHKKYPDSELVLVGDGELRAEIEEQISKQNLVNAVILTGEQKSVFEFLHNADVFTLTSFYEGLPMTLIEAMGSGLPIVATNVGGIKDTLNHEEDALLVEPEPDCICSAFIRMKESLELRERLGKNALLQSDSFSAKRMAEKYTVLYEKALKTAERKGR